MKKGCPEVNLRSVIKLTAVMFVSALVSMAPDAVPGLHVSTVTAQAPDVYRDVYDGWKWWHVYCFRCHGTNAVPTSTAPGLIDPNRALPPAAFLKIVRDGLPDKGMQAWDKLLDEKQIRQIHLYVRARTDKVLPPGRPDEVGPKGGPWVPPSGWPSRK
jgi:mono/diheme cytochrome c family protein